MISLGKPRLLLNLTGPGDLVGFLPQGWAAFVMLPTNCVLTLD
jgi:hypothetical protein